MNLRACSQSAEMLHVDITIQHRAASDHRSRQQPAGGRGI